MLVFVLELVLELLEMVYVVGLRWLNDQLVRGNWRKIEAQYPRLQQQTPNAQEKRDPKVDRE